MSVPGRNAHGPLTIAIVQMDVYVPRNAFAGIASWKLSVTVVGPVPVAEAALNHGGHRKRGAGRCATAHGWDFSIDASASITTTEEDNDGHD